MKKSTFLKIALFMVLFLLPKSFAVAEEHKLHLYILELGGYFPTSNKLDQYMSSEGFLGLRNNGALGGGIQIFYTMSTQVDVGLGVDYGLKELVADYYKEANGKVYQVGEPSSTSHDMVYWSLDLLARNQLASSKTFKLWWEGCLGYHAVGFGVSDVPDLFKSSFGGGWGGRLELLPTRWLSIFVRGQYKYILPVDFGTRVIEKGVVPEFKQVNVSGFTLRGGIGFHMF
jgi:hypothetical protein